ncbi:endonuclease/exonuclease/phosphatase family protein [Streptomyces sp. NPDC006314]|uniref:endonuclease/exonuclease/phosphatase family protein n=1 Tax=Streptomyces sp. NPDC006314 TaxID=3154475 RepID=UPI0033B727B7
MLGGAVALGAMTAPAQAAPEQTVTTPVVSRAAVVKDRVMSWNSNGQNLGTPELLVEQISRYKPQVVTLQESCRTEVREAVRRLKRQGLEYQIKFGPGTINVACDGWTRNGQAVLYAKGTPARDFDQEYYSDDEGPLEARGYMAFTTRLANRWVRVFNTQLSWGAYRDERKTQIKELLHAAQPYSQLLLAGDFNAQPQYSEMQPIWHARLSDVDPFCGGTYDSRCNSTHVKSDKKFDYILHRGVGSRNCLLHSVNEDHRVVVSDVSTAAGPWAACTVTWPLIISDDLITRQAGGRNPPACHSPLAGRFHTRGRWPTPQPHRGCG